MIFEKIKINALSKCILIESNKKKKRCLNESIVFLKTLQK